MAPGREKSVISTSEDPIGIALTTRPARSPPEIVVVSSWQPVARRFNRNFCAIINDAAGRKLFFKHNLGGNLKYIVTDSERRRRDICNILASRILNDIFSLHSVLYVDCTLFFLNERQLSGVACAYIEDLRWLQMVDAHDVVNKQDALQQMGVLTWLGDLDRLKNPSSDFVTRDGLYGTLDFDFCFNHGVSFFGLPIANRLALKYFDTLDTIESLITTIIELTDADIANMVGRIGNDWVNDWSDQYQSLFVGILIRNRERLKYSKSLRRFGGNRGPWSRFLDSIVTHYYETLIIPKKIQSIYSFQGALATIAEAKTSLIYNVKHNN
jgi:hypothetical protein